MILKWHSGEVPSSLRVRQVYGIIFTEDGRVLLKEEDGRFSLAGGTPEDFDEDMEATLRRELIEEVNTSIETPILLGYQEVDEENHIPPYAQVRMVAMIKNIGPVQADPDNGKTYVRLLTHPEKAIKYLSWGSIGETMIKEAVMLAKEKFGLKEFVDKDENV